MTKIMLVEDDKSLREIYGVRLLAEGYDIISAGDGEEALAMAIKERPDLIISDVMMPKISGFDMLDILRSTTETKDIRVIMMTALSSEEQKNRGQSLGADRYLVKSQVGIEDVVQVVHEVLGDKVAQQPDTLESLTAASTVPAGTTPLPPQPPVPPVQFAVPQAQQPAFVAAPSVQQPAPIQAPQQPATKPGFQFQSNQAPTTPSTIPKPSMPPLTTSNGNQRPVGSSNKIIQPISSPTDQPVNFSELLDKELAKEAGISESDLPAVGTVAEEKAIIDQQLTQYEQTPAPTPITMTAERQDDESILSSQIDGLTFTDTPTTSTTPRPDPMTMTPANISNNVATPVGTDIHPPTATTAPESNLTQTNPAPSAASAQPVAAPRFTPQQLQQQTPAAAPMPQPQNPPAAPAEQQ